MKIVEKIKMNIDCDDNSLNKKNSKNQKKKLKIMKKNK